MSGRISSISFFERVARYLPAQLSSENICNFAKKALEELPWVAGSGAAAFVLGSSYRAWAYRFTLLPCVGMITAYALPKQYIPLFLTCLKTELFFIGFILVGEGIQQV